MGMLRIPVAVDVHLLTAFFVVVEILAVSFRIPDLPHLPEAVVAVSNGVSVRVRGAGDVAGIVVGVVFHASFRRADLQDPSPVVQNEVRPVPVPVCRSGHGSYRDNSFPVRYPVLYLFMSYQSTKNTISPKLEQ